MFSGAPRRFPGSRVAFGRPSVGPGNRVGNANPTRLSDAKPSGTATAWYIAGNDPKAFNTVNDKPVAIQEQSGLNFGGRLKVAPFSVTLIRLPASQE